MHFTPVSSHLLAILSAGIEVSHFISTKHIVHIFGQLSLQRSHNGEFLANEYLGKQFVSTCEYHSLFLEVLNMCAFGQELRHIMHLVTRFLRKTVTCSRKNSSTDKHGYIRELCDKFLHQCQILRTIIFGRHVDLQKSNINITQIIIITLWRVADEQFTLWVVVL